MSTDQFGEGNNYEQQQNLEDILSGLPQEKGEDRQFSSEQSKQTDDKVSDTIPTTQTELIEKLSLDIGYQETFDITVRHLIIAEQNVSFVSLSGLMNSQMVLYILERLTYIKQDELEHRPFHTIFSQYIPNAQVKVEKSWNKAMTSVLGGESLLFIEGSQDAMVLETRNYPSRGMGEPELEKVVRGSRDGFNETMLTNISLVRRRLRDPKLRYIYKQVGERTRTDIAIAYIDDLVDKDLLKVILHKIDQLKVDGLPLADKQLEEAIFQKGWSPFPLVRYSERPDTVSSHLLEGAITIFVDTSPSVMILPTTYFDLLQHAEENRQTPLVGTYLRWVRFIGIINSLVLLPLWLLLVLEPQYTPEFLSFIAPKESAYIPIVMQLIIAEVAIDLLRLASVHTPSSIATAMSLVAAIMLGDLAVNTGWLVTEVILYFAIAAVGMFATPSYELSLANRLIRLSLIITVAAFGLIGFIVPLTVFFILLVTQRSVNRPYMWPLIPFDLKACMNVLIRKPMLANRIRPNINKPQQFERNNQNKS